MNTVGAPCAGKPHAGSDAGALGTPTPIHDDGLSPCVGNSRNRQPGLPISPEEPVLYSTHQRSALLGRRFVRLIPLRALREWNLTPSILRNVAPRHPKPFSPGLELSSSPIRRLTSRAYLATRPEAAPRIQAGPQYCPTPSFVTLLLTRRLNSARFRSTV